MKGVLTLFVLAVLMASCASSDDTTPEQKRAEIYYNYGTNMLVEQKYTEALKNLLEAYKLNSTDSRICNNLGMAYYFKGQVPTAISFVQKSIELDPKNSDAKINLASIYYSQKKYDQALQIYQQVTNDLVYDNQYRTYNNIALIYQEKGMNMAAEEHYKLAIKENPEYCPAYYNYGKLALSRHDYKNAIQILKQGIGGQCFEQPATHMLLGEAYLKNGEYSLAEERFKDIITRFGNTNWGEMAKKAMVKVSPLAKQDYKPRETDIDEAVKLYEKIKKESEEKKENKTPSF